VGAQSELSPDQKGEFRILNHHLQPAQAGLTRDGRPWGVAAAPGGADEALSNEQILRNMATVLFGSEFIGEESSYVRKWVGPLRLAVVGDSAGAYRDLVTRHLGTLRRLTGLDIEQVALNAPQRNAYIRFVSRAEFESQAHAYLAKGKPGTNQNLACFGIFKSNGERDIVEFTAVIPRSGSREEVEACIIEEVTQVLGLPNDSFTIRPTIFNDDDEYHELTWQDRLMLQVLYDRRIEPGMSRAAFKQMARAILGELRPETGTDFAAAPEPVAQPALLTPASLTVVETPSLARDHGQQ
jgi:hypothetical protein